MVTEEISGCRLILFATLVSGLGMGYIYSLDLPQALEIPLEQSPFNLSSTQYDLINLSTNIFSFSLMIPASIVISNSPLNTVLFILLVTLMLCNFITGVLFQLRFDGYFIFVCFFRGILGLFGESVFVMKAAIMVKYAREKYEVVAGLVFAVPFVFEGVASFVTTQVISATNNLPLTFYIAGLLCGVTVLFGLVLYVGFLKIPEEKEQTSKQLENEQFSCESLKRLNHVYFIFVLANSSLIAVSVFFIQSMTDLLVKTYGIPYDTCGQLTFFIFFTTFVASLAFGKTIDCYPDSKRQIYFFSIFFQLPIVIGVYLLPLTQEPTIVHYFWIMSYCFSVGVNISIALMIASWLSYVVSEDMIKIAFCINAMAIAFGQGISPVLTNLVLQNTSIQLDVRYQHLMFVMCVLAAGSLMLSAWVYFDQKKFGFLDKNIIEMNIEEEPKQKYVEIQ